MRRHPAEERCDVTAAKHASTMLHSQILTFVWDFAWTTESTGNDKRYSKDPDVTDGGYCRVPNIDKGENGALQTIDCYFPCVGVDLAHSRSPLSAHVNCSRASRIVTVSVQNF